ncbi:MAG TPA: ATP-dependent carboxylate-amine ligase [Lentisphaeria bacterium]|nr:MAG: hypothetical protein A2X47_09220 [Lentisphaerae bacterium GWF2_38_69]HBM15421.1 ATP-dependent carboxylate-amine ligase [Lentisphaeria bacterium]
MHKVKIGVTGTGSLIGQAIIKSIRDSDIADTIEIIGFDYFADTVGSFWCGRNYLLPDILQPKNKENWYALILEVIKKEQIAIIFIGVDFELPLLAEQRHSIEENAGCKVVVSSEQVIEIGNDKYLTYKFLKENSFNYPKTWLESEIIDASLEYPCILKPREGARSKDVYIVKDQDYLLNKIRSVKNPIVQELIGDEEHEYTCGVLCFDSKIVSSIVLGRCLKDGNTYIAEYRDDYDRKIYDYIEQVALKLKPNGSCNMQLRTNAAGEPYLFEINPRFSGTTYIRSLFGYKEVEYTIKHLLGMKTYPFYLKQGKAYRYYEEKLLENGR